MSQIVDNYNSTQKSFLPFSRPSLSSEAVEEVVRCLYSGQITTGPKVKEFEKLLCEYIGVPYVITFSSATAGLHAALFALDLQPGDEIITTPMTFVATINMIIQAGGKPVFADINSDNYNIDIDQIEALITTKTKAILPVHFAGYPVDLDQVYFIAKKYSIRVIEDCAHAIGSEYKKQKIGSFGDIQVFSFHANKNITTGEGGCICVRDLQLAKRLQKLRFHGIDREAWNRFNKGGSQIYDLEEPGFKYNMMDIQAALGIHQIKQLNYFINRRKHLAFNYLKYFQNWPELQLPSFKDYEHKHAWHLFNILIRSFDRNEFILRMQELNIGIGLHYQPVHLFKYYRKKFGFKNGDFPISEKVGKSIVSLPIFPTMTDEEQLRVINGMHSIIRKEKK